MFMKEMPENPEDNELLMALQALRYSGSADDVATEFMENSQKSLTLYKQTKQFKHLKEAMLFICDAIEHLKTDQEISKEMRYQIYFFRSGIHILVKNYGYAINDLKEAIKNFDKDEAHLKIADCLINLGEENEAKKIIEQRLNSNLNFFKLL